MSEPRGEAPVGRTGNRGWLAIAAAALTAGCAIAELPEGPGFTDDATADDSAGDATCDPGTCFTTCFALGRPGGSCVGADCACDEPGADADADIAPDAPGPDADADVPDVADDAPVDDGRVDVPADATCDPGTCSSACRSIGWPGGNCVGADCRCSGGADADADVPDVADDGARDDGTVDDGPIDDGYHDDGTVDDGTVDDGSVDDGTVDDGGVVAWGTPICDTTGGVLADASLFGTPTNMSLSLVVPSLGNGRVMRLDITIPVRRFIVELPFNDLEVTLTPPSGTGAARTFWYHFDGPGGDFMSPWYFPVWWDAPVAGTWTISFKDVMRSGLSPVNTTVSNWCLTPLDPAAYATTNTGAAINACTSPSDSITDYCYMDDPDPCTEHPISSEVQVNDLVRAGSAPSVTLGITHGAWNQLQIDLIAANGTTTRIWNRLPGPPAGPISVPSLNGVWLTGRYQLYIVDKVEGTTGTLNSWCISAN